MGDRCYVEITIRKSDMQRLVRGFFDGNNEKFFDAAEANDVWENDDGTITLAAEEVNYASWHELENILHDHNIEYDKTNSAGIEYGAGSEYARMVPGNGLMSIDIGETEYFMGEFIKKVLTLDDPIKMREALASQYRQIYPFEVVPLGKEG